MHEHLLADLSVFFAEPEQTDEKELAYRPLSLENLSMVRFGGSNLDNCRLTDEALAVREATRFKDLGGATIVEMSSTGLRPDPAGLARISIQTGLNIVMGTAFYIGSSQSPEVQSLTEKQMIDRLVGDIEKGVGEPGIKAGVIGEVGVSAPIEDFERRSLRASASAQQATGAMITVHPSHPGIDKTAVVENIRILKEAGADLGRVVISHIDCMEFTADVIHTLLDQGCVVEYDTFGLEGIFGKYFGHPQNAPTDKQRIHDIIGLIDEGYIRQITISTDRCYKSMLTEYGGGGYGHILKNDLPLMRHFGMTDEQINTLLVENPKRLLPLSK
jgi:phosphotriesterase-related protein